MEMDKDQLEQEVNRDTEQNDVIYQEMETLQERLRQSTQEKEKIEFRHKEKINDMKNEMNEVDKRNSESKEKVARLEKELKEFKESREKRTKDIEEGKNKLAQKEKELALLKNKTESWDKEKEYLKKDYEESKKTLEKLKHEYKEIVEKMKANKEHQTGEIKKYEEKISNIDKKLENEKNQVIILNEKLKVANANLEKAMQGSSTPRSSRTGPTDNQEIGQISSLSDALESVAQENKLEAMNIELRNEVESLKKKIQDVTTKTQNKANAEIEVLKKENAAVKQNIKEMQQMYEGQIKELQKKTVTVNAEYQNFRRTTSKLSIKGDPESLTKYLQAMSEMDNKVKTAKAEVKYLEEKIELLTQDIENQKNIREKDVKFLKEEIKTADGIAVQAKVQLAQVVFEKDDQIMHLKSSNKKLKNRLVQLTGGAITVKK